MSRSTLLSTFFLLFLAALRLDGQNQNAFVVMNVSGDVTFREQAGGTARALVPTQVLGLDAVVSLGVGSSVRLVYGHNQISLNDAGNYPLKSLAAGKKQEPSSFTGRFFNYIYEGVINTSGSKNIEEYHKQYLTKSSGGIKGFAGGTYGVEITRAVTGNVVGEPVRFEWFSCGDSTFYDFQIADYQTDGLVFKALLRDTSIQVDLAQLALDPGRRYYWHVQRKNLGELPLGFALVDDPSLRSLKMEFFLSGRTEQEVMAPSEADAEFRNAAEWERLLMAAQTLEENRLVYSAQLSLLKALDLEPGNDLVRRVYAAFLIRQGLVQAAQAFVDKHQIK